MSLTLSRATPEDIPGMLEIWFNAFENPIMLQTFPNTPAGHAYLSASFTRSMANQHTTFMLMTEPLPNGRRRVASWTKWVLEDEGGPSHWSQRWGAEMAEGMSEDQVGKGFFDPMARQHATSTAGRKHFCKFHLLTPVLNQTEIVLWLMKCSS